ncbi:MAG: hypothetical protein AB9844_12315 [Clostridiaceae bacterium]
MQQRSLSKGQKIFYFLLYIPCLYIGRNLDNDIWFILNSGKYVMEHGIPYIEPFTIHEGLSFLMQQWLSAVAFWGTYKYFGEIGLLILVLLFYIIFIHITYKLCMFLSENNFPVSFMVTMIVSGLMSPFMVERPHIFLFIIMLSEIFLLEKYIKSKKRVYLFPLPVLSILLINLEAAIWPIVFVILIPYLIDSFKFKMNFIGGQGYEKTWLFCITLVSCVAGLINPYGVKAVTYLFKSYGSIEMHYAIQEMSPADINSIIGKIIILTIFLVFFSYVIYKEGKSSLRFYLLAIGTAFLALSSIRSFAFFIICGIIPLSYYYKDFKIKGSWIKNDKKTLLIRKTLMILIAIAVVFSIVYKNSSNGNIVQQDLVSCVDYLDKLNGDNIKLYSGFNEGGYIEFRGYKTYIDPRAEVFLETNNNKDDIFKEYIQMKHGDIYYKNVLNKYNFDYLVVGDNDILFQYLDYDEDYKLVYSNLKYKIYKRNNMVEFRGN